MSGRGAQGRSREAWTFPLAYLGTHIAFMPLLVFLLPRRVEAIAGPQSAIVLSWLLLGGAIVASVAHVAGGYLGDRWFAAYGDRRGIIAFGVMALFASFVILGLADTVPRLAGALVFFQFALNLTFAPLGTLLADYTPDASKGTVAGMLNAALPLSSAATALLAWQFPQAPPSAFIANGILAAASIAPLLLLWNFRPAPGESSDLPCPTGGSALSIGRDFALAWMARFLVQLGSAFVIGFLFLLISHNVQSDGNWAGGRSASGAIAVLSLAASAVAIVGAVAAGRLSDRIGARRWPLAVAAAGVATCLALLGAGTAWPVFLGAYALFQLALSGFLAIDLALVAQLIGPSSRRGALLGLMNLANTIPAVVAPAIALASLRMDMTGSRIELFFSGSAVAALLSAGLILAIRRVR
ncbi:hypothetical protein GCM10011515_00700 [Tsuneonella deserti]|uniref:Major facilitator superfamily (MFS) profile domain-containing protein n=1 Tax=Tsuneonella deserti TaxID=2035528 RepID=A0ABQ1S027_9SPHN|nr:MFS transporter [Tsuneonella deserti]GGD84835.1 hypothetical protein GCM10011515_00700 [Tsuneonella deserti]